MAGENPIPFSIFKVIWRVLLEALPQTSTNLLWCSFARNPAPDGTQSYLIPSSLYYVARDVSLLRVWAQGTWWLYFWLLFLRRRQQQNSLWIHTLQINTRELFDEAEPTAPLLLLVAAISTAPPISRAFFALTPNSSRLIYLFATRLCYYRLLFGIFTSHTFTLSSSTIIHRISTANFYHYTIGVLKSP